MTLSIFRNRQEPAAAPHNALRNRNNFDALRLIAALCVVIQHAATHLNGNFFWYKPENGLWFTDGVAVFFIISGGMVYASAEKCMNEARPLIDYLINRLLRIIPAIYAYLATCLVLLPVLGIVDMRTILQPGMVAWAASTALLAPVYHPEALHGFGTGVMNGSLWTIPAEVGFYLIVPLLVIAARRYTSPKTIAGAFLVGAAGSVAYAIAVEYAAENTAVKIFGVTFIPWLGYFTIGIAAHRYWKRLPQKWYWALTAAFAYVTISLSRRYVDEMTGIPLGLIGAFPLAYLTMWIGYRGPSRLRRFTAKIGDLSFGVYIWHMPLVNLALWLGVEDGPLKGTALVSGVAAASLMLAYASWHAVEKPALRLKRYSSRPDAAT